MSAEIVVETAGASLRDHRGGHRMTEEKILAWHFTEGRTLRDGQPLFEVVKNGDENKS